MFDPDLNENERLIQTLCHDNVTGLIYVVGKWKEAESRCAILEDENKKLKKMLKDAGVDADANADDKIRWYHRFWKV